MSKFERGDTIVEVLFAIAVIGFVLGASYASASRSTRIGRDAQEHTEALKVAETQIERLKYLASTTTADTVGPDTDLFDPDADDFCMSNALVKESAIDSGTHCNGIDGSRYDAVIHFDTKGDSVPENDVFFVTIKWERQISDVEGNVQIAYKLHNGTN